MTDDDTDPTELFPTDDDAPRRLAFDLDAETEPTTDQWDVPVPARKLWVNPDLDTTAEEITDPDTYRGGRVETAACPMDGCEAGFGLNEPPTYGDMATIDGVVRCGACRTAMFAHKHPPRHITDPP